MARIRQFLGGCVLVIGAASSALGQDLPPLPPLPQDVEQVVDAETLRGLLAYATLFGTFPAFEDARWSEYYCRNGKSIYLVDDVVEEGVWWIAEPQVCFAYERPEGSETFCYLTYRLTDGSYLMRSLESSFDVRIQGRIAGDAFNMQRLKGMACEDLSS